VNKFPALRMAHPTPKDLVARAPFVRRVRMAACMLAAGLLLVAPAAANAATTTWAEGTSGHPFHLTRFGVLQGGPTNDPALSLPYELVKNSANATDWVPTTARPQTIQALGTASSLSILYADPWLQFARVVGPNGSFTWTYDAIAKLGRDSAPVAAMRTSAGSTLIVDSKQPQVVEVNSSGTELWHYGDGSVGTDVGHLAEPWWAARLSNGNTLIVDGIGGYRVLEVDHNESTPTVVWHYGTGVSGVAGGQLKFPTYAERLSNGNTLICDRDGNRVLEVSSANNVVWTFGTGATAGKTTEPTFATRLSNGDTLITDSGNKRVIQVNGDGAIVQSYGDGTALPSGGGLIEPLMAQRLTDGSTLVADADVDNRSGKVIRYGYSSSGYATASQNIPDSTNTTLKRFKTVSWHGVPAGGSIAVYYQIQGGTLKLGGTQKSGTSGSFSLPSASAYYMSYKVVLTRGTSYGATPILKDLSIAWEPAPVGATLTYPAAGTNTNTNNLNTINPSYVGTSSVETSYAAFGTDTTATAGSGIQRGAIMAPAGGLIDDPTREVRVGSGASTKSQLAGVGVVALVLILGFAFAPLARAVPKLRHAAAMMLK
jgi:hypothetical protein